MPTHKPWGGRFQQGSSRLTELYTESLSYDRRLALYDLRGTGSHVKALHKARVLTSTEVSKMIAGLKALEKDLRAGKIKWDPFLEDVHMNLETLLVKKIGPLGKKVHTGRSRNDQVLTDLRLYVKDAVLNLGLALLQVQRQFILLAEKYTNVPMPGYTHLQRAQPVLLGHHLLAYVEMFERDKHRLAATYEAADVLVLGSAALAGTAYAIPREFVAKDLGFAAVSQNSMDAVADRDFVTDALYACAVMGIHLSRLGEELVLWSSSEFGFVSIGDAFTTGSSIMPQKKNSDVAELLRGKSGRLLGNLVALLTALKGLPLTYNRDLQEDKEPLFDSLDTVYLGLQVLGDLLPTLQFNTERMRRAALENFSAATDLADALVKKGLPFRDAHAAVGQAVAYCERQLKNFENLLPDEWPRALGKKAAGLLTPLECTKAIRLENILNIRNVTGGTAPGQVQKQIGRWKKKLGF